MELTDIVSASELAFLAMGLVLGVAAGAALVEVLRSRPPAPREVRVTVAPDAVPRRRAATLANDAFNESPVAAEPAVGGPADRRAAVMLERRATSDRRTSVLTNAPSPSISRPATAPAASAMSLGQRPRVVPEPVAPERVAAMQGMAISSGVDPMLTALRATAAASSAAASVTTGAASVRATSASARAEPAIAIESPPTVSMATADLPEPMRRPSAATAPGPPRDGSARATATGAMPPAGAAKAAEVQSRAHPSASGPCDDARRLADERCELAGRAKTQAAEADDAHRAAQRTFDDHEAAAAAAREAGDPRAVRRSKDDAQARFRSARAIARSPDQVEAAAREWLQEINRINALTADASAVVTRARAAATDAAAELERTGLAADRARIAAEAAEAACTGARQALADCEEQAAGRLPSPRASGPNGDQAGEEASGDTLVAAMRAGSSPRILRLLRGERAAMFEIVSALGGTDSEARRRWQLAMADLVDAILADAIAASALEFPTDHPFWGPFDRTQAREITAALSSLGYRFDGLGGWVDGRYPSQRDLSLALGYAGFDPMRNRQWPTEAEMETLFGDVQVSAAEHLSSVAGDLTLGGLVSMLGRRADALAEIWNAWGRIRPLLLEER